MRKPLIYIFLIHAILFSVGSAFGQSNIGDLMISNKYKGDRFFDDLYYEKAITYYLLALKKDSDKDALRLKIGECYRLLHEYDRAIYWYAQVLENNPEGKDPVYKYHYANMLLSAEEEEEALKWFKEYKQDVPEDSRSARKIHGINAILDYYVDYDITEIDLLPINTLYSEVAPMFYSNGIVFVSARENTSFSDQDFLRKEDLYDLYFVPYDSTSGWGETRMFDKVLNTPFHEGPISFFSGEDKLFLTRSNYYDKHQTKDTLGKTRLQLFTAVKTGDLWAIIQPFELDNPEYSIAHPSLNQTNDTLFFASDMPGGFGGTDIYMSTFNHKWSIPVNLGPKVNTEGDEMFPFYVSNRLFFASDGNEGLGGLDIYKGVINEKGEVAYITNLGSPINSPMDDFSYIINPVTKTGFFASNRDGGLGSDDIYSFVQKEQVLKGIAIQEQDRSPLAGVQINLFKDGFVIATTVTGSDGTFKFYLPLSSDFTITAEKEEHSFNTALKITTRGSRVDLDTLLIEMHKHDFFARGRVYDSETQKGLHETLVILKDPESLISDSLFTGPSGLYSFVIEPGKNYLIKVGKERFSSDSVEINTHSIEKGIITNDFVLDEEFIEKKIIFFDYDKYDLRKDGISELEKMMDILKSHPKDWLIIGAHADARGTREYNLVLSNKRAAKVVEFFISRGISMDRIVSRGFGEALIINRCTNGVNCTEEDHSKNRRAEIFIEKNLSDDKLKNLGF